MNGKSIWFRGLFNTYSHAEFVFSLLPPELTDTFVVNGCSAGGLATYTWIDQIYDYLTALNPKVKVFGIPDSGFFVDYPSNATGKNDYGNKIKALVETVNQVSPIPDASCVAKNKENPHYCMLAEHLVKEI